MPGMQKVGEAVSVPVGDASVYGTLTRQDFLDSSNQHQLRTYTLVWETVTTPLKAQYLGYDQSPQNVEPRLDGINGLRQAFMDDRAVDVILYVGQYKAALQRTIKNALKVIHEQLKNRRDQQNDFEYVFVSWSLGSKMVYDCLAQTQGGAGDPDFDEIARKTRAFYMLANQLPLLELGDLPSPGVGERASTQASAGAYQSLIAVARKRKAAANVPLWIVAISDPNDLLSYPLPPVLENSGEANFSNVFISVAKTGIYIPFVGWLANLTFPPKPDPP
jgi:hypothetical protein